MRLPSSFMIAVVAVCLLQLTEGLLFVQNKGVPLSLARHRCILHTSETNLSHRKQQVVDGSSSKLSSLPTSKVDDVTLLAVLPGVEEFERWFHDKRDSPASCSKYLQHANFGSLRGLAWTGPLVSEATCIVTLPTTLVPQTEYPHPQWHVRLAEQLWRECRHIEGTNNMYGYCSLLTLGSTTTTSPNQGNSDRDNQLPSTAPNALRHWKDYQKQWLIKSPAGVELLKTADRQELHWKSLYEQTTSSSPVRWTYSEFVWAMEAVHSRAYCGSFGKVEDVGALVVTLAPMVVAALAGGAYWNSTPEPSNLVLGLLASLAMLGQWYMTAQQDDNTGRAVLLPLIDSANHIDTADSRIEYDPLRQVFSLTIGPKCLVPTIQSEDSAESANPPLQVMVNYGRKTDTELMLNYGFLSGMPCSVVSRDDDETDLDAQRRWLAEEFLRRSNL